MKIKKTVISTFGESSSSFRPGVEHFAIRHFFWDTLYIFETLFFPRKLHLVSYLLLRNRFQVVLNVCFFLNNILTIDLSSELENSKYLTIFLVVRYYWKFSISHCFDLARYLQNCSTYYLKLNEYYVTWYNTFICYNCWSIYLIFFNRHQ